MEASAVVAVLEGRVSGGCCRQGQLVLSSRTARTVGFLYTLLLHLLVFAVLYKMAYTDMYRRQLSSDCAER